MNFFRLLLFFLLLSTICNSQTRENVFNLKSITWLGVDFSHLKCIGTYAQWGDENKLVIETFPKWNELIIDRPKRYDLGKTFNNSDVNIDLQLVQKINFNINPDSVVFNDLTPALLKHDILALYIKKYVGHGKKGWGALLIGETFNLKNNRWILDILIFDLNTGEIGVLRRLTTKSSGCTVNRKFNKTVHYSLKKIRNGWSDWELNDGVKK